MPITLEGNLHYDFSSLSIDERIEVLLGSISRLWKRRFDHDERRPHRAVRRLIRQFCADVRKLRRRTERKV